MLKKHQKNISIFLICLMFLSAFTGVSPVFADGESDDISSPVVDKEGNVTFNAEHEGEQLYVVGSMNEWDAENGIEMEKQDGVFTATYHLNPGTYEYKFVQGTSWDDGDFLDPQNPLEEDGNSVVHVPGVSVNDLPSTLERGTETELDGAFINSDGEVSDVDPTWTLLEEPSGVELDGQKLLVTDQAETDQTFTLQAEYDGYKSQQEISIIGNMNEYTINYYRYDGQAQDWEAWIFGDALDGDAYQFDTVNGDYAQGTYQFVQDEITIITRLGDWDRQEMDRRIQMPQGEDHVEVWIVEGDEEVYYSEPEIEDYSAPTVRFEYERENKDYEDWNVWVWNTGAKDDQIDFDDIGDVAIANIEVGPNIKKMGFKLRKGQDWEEIDIDQDREINVSPTENVTKVFVKEGEVDFRTVPFASGPSVNEDEVTFFYRDADLYEKNAMETIESVQVKIDDKTYDMNFEAENERFVETIHDLDQGTYEYTYLVTIDGETTEISDPYNLDDDGKSVIDISSLDLAIHATLSETSMNYNEHAILTVDLLDQDEKDIDDDFIRNISVDLSSLGGKADTTIDKSLKTLSLSVNDTVETGDKTLPITVTDKYGGTHKTEVDIHIEPRIVEDENDFDWDEARIYFMLTDRFADGNEANNDQIGYDPSQPGAYQGGDFKGITENLDYLEELGINTIWITPIVENVYHDVAFDDDNANIPYYGYHGYWALDFEKLNPHLGTLDEFHELIDAANEHGIKLMVDVVLNHSGYGLKTEDGDINNPPEGFPSDEDRDKFADMLRQDGGDAGDEVTGELAGLPDFITEDPEVRNQLVEWQTNWLEKATTENGNTIDYYRVDTVKHVDDATLMHFKNELTKADPEFKLIGEAFGASPNNEYANRYLNTGTMDSLLDFDFKNIASRLVNGEIETVNANIKERTDRLDSSATMGQFLGSHDEPGFLHFIGDQDPSKLKIASTLQITSKGQPVIYYGEELGLSGEENWPEYDNRYVFPWDEVEGNDVHDHYQKLLNIRADYSKLFSKGNYELLAGDDETGYLVFERTYDGESAIVGINTTDEAQDISLTVPFQTNTTVNDLYNDTTIEVGSDKNANVHLPGKADGGTFILVSDKVNDEEDAVTPIPEDTLRVHYKRDDNQFSDLGLWLWEDVAEPSDNWPNGSTPFTDEQQTDYGAYLDIPLKKDAQKVGLLVVNTKTGDKEGDDKFVELFSKDINEVWIEEGSDTVSLVEPVDLPDDTIRVHYEKENDDYDDLGIWTWDDVEAPSDEWPNGATDPTGIGSYGAYYDVKLTEDPEKVSFLFVNKENEDQSIEYTHSDFEHDQLFVIEGDENIYTNPYGAISTMLLSGEILSDEKIQLKFSRTDELTEEDLEAIQLVDKNGEEMTFDEATIIDDTLVELYGNFNLDTAPFSVTFGDQTIEIDGGWKMIDEMYAYDGDLGATLHDDGTATLKLWSPKADDVSIVLYDADDQYKVIEENIPLTMNEKGVWEVQLDKENTGLDSLRGYYYHYKVTHGDKTKLALDPYAKSMAGWADKESGGDYSIGKAAIVDPSSIGPELGYADIDGFEKREDAIIYEVHVRDFTSDPNISEELDAQFGTFASFVEKLDYIEDLGVTHIQLLPVMSYYFGNEWESNECLLDWSSSGNNYNWGYDPHSYFSLTGMYSENPDDPEQRIEEFKRLIDEIHDRGMGVTLDVVYNHTAKVDIFEDLVPNYYHFMDADGTPRESFGGGRLGTTHEMSRKLLVDSITYWVDEFKVDGFRFDMMGDHDAETIQLAYDEAKALNPNIIMIGEGWVTYEGDEGDSVTPADQQWMKDTESVGSFSDDFRNELKSGFGSEGEPRFLTGGARSVQQIFDNVTAKPHNFLATNPGDVVPYIAAHDNLTLHDVIAQSIKKDPEHHQEEIHKRIRLGNAMVLTSQGTAFIHAGQEFGRTKQFRDETDEQPYKSTYMTDENGEPFEYPYFIHDSYDSTDIINKIDWDMATNAEAYPIHNQTREYTTGLVELRRSTDAFSLGTMDEIDDHVSFIDAPEINDDDLIIGYKAVSSDKSEIYAVFVNADDAERTLTLDDFDLTKGDVIVDGQQAGTEAIDKTTGVQITAENITIDPLTTVIVKLNQEEAEEPGEPEKPEEPEDPSDPKPEPGKPGEPGEPEDPSEPGKPGEPEDPSEPGTPGDTDEPGEPSKPETPGDPDEDGDDTTGGQNDDGVENDEDGQVENDGDTAEGGTDEEQDGEKLPKTATTLYNMLLIGAILFAIGLMILYARMRMKKGS